MPLSKMLEAFKQAVPKAKPGMNCWRFWKAISCIKPLGRINSWFPQTVLLLHGNIMRCSSMNTRWVQQVIHTRIERKDPRAIELEGLFAVCFFPIFLVSS